MAFTKISLVLLLCLLGFYSETVKSQNCGCGPNLCCSQYGYCGTDDAYCGAGCRSVPTVPAVPPKLGSKEITSEDYVNQGNQAFEEFQWQKAIGLYSEAIKLSDNNATYYSNRAAAYLEIGCSLQAEEDCTKAISLDKKNIKAYLHRGIAREMLIDFKGALEDFRYALVLEPNNTRASLSAERLRKLPVSFFCPCLTVCSLVSP